MGLDHACGGVCACSTCHVIVHEGLESATNRPTPNSISSTMRRADGKVASRLPVRA